MTVELPLLIMTVRHTNILQVCINVELLAVKFHRVGLVSRINPTDTSCLDVQAHDHD